MWLTVCRTPASRMLVHELDRREGSGTRGMQPRDGARRTRIVDRLAIHGEPIDFQELCRRAVPEDTRYLVLDLDRTLHLARNMGELLGWELCAYHAYGLDRLAEVEGRRPATRFFLDWSRPWSLLRYLLIGARMWAYPGLFYLFCGKIPSRLELTRRWSFRAFGAEPVAAVQRVPQLALMHQMAAVPAAHLRMLARRVWDRFGDDQVIEREDLAWLRARCPGVRIVIASASPQPMLEVAAEALGVDDVIYSTLEERGGYFSAPFQLHRLFLQPGAPRRICGPSLTRINSNRAKIETLLARYPDLADPSVVSVGMTDTGYGEDHCWARHFTRVVDVNSSAPFPPFVERSSPLREIHSASLLTRSEKARRAAGEHRYLAPRRPPPRGRSADFGAEEMRAGLGRLVAEVEALSAELEERASRLVGDRLALQSQLSDLKSRIDATVRAYNDASRRARRKALAQLRRELREKHALRRRLVRLERPVSEVACALSAALAASRAALAREPAAPEAPRTTTAA